MNFEPINYKANTGLIGNFHGGQSWREVGDRLIADMSVTTNYQGPPPEAIAAAQEEFAHLHHYPDQTCAEARTALSDFLQMPTNQILIGNGASELIELVVRLAPEGNWRPGPFAAQYSEYERAAKLSNRKIVPFTEQAAVTTIVNPNSPTGHFLSLPQLASIIESSEGFFIIDESFLFFEGPHWRDHSAMNLIDRFPDRLVIVQSLTKIWSCTGLRIGCITGSPELILNIAGHQVPWSVNSPAQKFICEAVKCDNYMEVTWNTIPRWKEQIQQHITRLGWSYNRESPLWVPWIFVNTGSEEIADEAERIGLAVGVPVRWCKSHGCPTCLRFGVRNPEAQKVLFKALMKLKLKDQPNNSVPNLSNLENIFGSHL
eukprot:TRINITY_DN3137_c0_g4_i1.p1 TRINITY_DN3137_c0_g4~~TRINITY_DN3137_c0_g4_i1.p1  ORF type:complete len:373 (-),score=99.25 TRINITY_DN3137_c0_g4_i1:28-1146(-)